jgi:ribonuclease P protein component
LACNQKTSQSFPRRYRLGRREGFSQILKSGLASKASLFVIHHTDSKAGHARLGITVSKRVVPAAVDRNRIKRLIREEFRSLARTGEERDVVVRLRKLPLPEERCEAGRVLYEALQKVLSVDV